MTKVIEEIYKSSERIYEDLYHVFMYNCGFQILLTKLSLGYDTYRIRDFNDIREIRSKDNVKYPPVSKTYSRIGKPDQIWFYVSDDIGACLAEMMPIWYSKNKPGQDINIIVSTWQVRREVTVIIIPDLMNINEVCRQIDLSPYHSDKVFWSYICSKFRSTTLDEKDIYQFTSAFANALVDRASLEGKQVDGIFYPSVQYPIKSNLALRTSCVDDDQLVLRYLCKTVFKKLMINGIPKYEQITDRNLGCYDPEKDLISWA